MTDQRHAPDDLGLDGLGRRLRTEAAAHHLGDLPGLEQRSASRQRRTRVGVAVASLALLAGTGALGMALGGPEPIEPTPAATTTAVPTTELPRWPTHSVVITDPDIWAVEVVYDPDRWDTQRLYDEAMPPSPNRSAANMSASSYQREPKGYLYWTGTEAEAGARTAQTHLQGLPGIVSVQLGRGIPSEARGTNAVPPGSTPGTGQPGTVPPGAGTNPGP